MLTNSGKFTAAILLILIPFHLYGDVPSRKICIRNICLEAEVADSEPLRMRGLMMRESLPEGRGMLFILDEEGLYSFWMKNMNFALDIIWIDALKKIVDIDENVQPCIGYCHPLVPVSPAKYVLEVNPGFAKKNGIKIGDKVRF